MIIIDDVHVIITLVHIYETSLQWQSKVFDEIEPFHLQIPFHSILVFSYVP